MYITSATLRFMAGRKYLAGKSPFFASRNPLASVLPTAVCVRPVVEKSLKNEST